jgi:ABC-type sugar transport system substrate-binding protein
VSDPRVSLFLVDEANEFQRLLQLDAEQTASRVGLGMETFYSGIDFARQLAQIQECLERSRPEAILVMCVNDGGLLRVAKRAAQSGVHVILLNGLQDDLAAVRAEHTEVAIAIVCPDELETGRIQGRQFRKIVPPRGRVLYVQGRVRSQAARDRTAGMLEIVSGAPFEVVPIEAGWTLVDGREAVGGWLRMTLRVNRHIDLIGCQNDALAQGVLQALESVASELGRPEIARIPVTGCDGSPALGQPLVRRGVLRATVVLPRSTGPAVEVVDRVLRTGELPPPTVLLKGHSFPSEDELSVLGLLGRVSNGLSPETAPTLPVRQ